MIYIPSPAYARGPAAHALAMEGVDYQEVVCTDRWAYGRLFSRLWDEGQAFVIVEWDVVPFPGAAAELAACPSDYCTRRYPLHQGKLALSFGIGKYRPTGIAPLEWAEKPWHLLDGFVIPHVRKVLGPPCVHEPPVAHARPVLAP